VQALRDRLHLATDTPIDEWDERLTTGGQAEAPGLGYSEKVMRDKLDQLSAVLMLEQTCGSGTQSDPERPA
jgi:RNase H-fold protein (predicted Holliday junction resolvase)